MDGSAVVIPSAKPPAGLAREDALFRIVYYGEALRAMTEHVSDSLISGPCVPMIEMLDEAFDTLSSKRDSFGPEEFTLFVMSKMLGLCDDADEARQFQVGAAQYILKSAKALPDTYKPVIDDARQLLRRSALTHVTAARSCKTVPDGPAKQDAGPRQDIAPSSGHPEARRARVADIAAPAVAAPPSSMRPPSRRPRATSGARDHASRTAPRHLATVTDHGHAARSRGSRVSTNFLDDRPGRVRLRDRGDADVDSAMSTPTLSDSFPGQRGADPPLTAGDVTQPCGASSLRR
jgi:hypothetical protein